MAASALNPAALASRLRVAPAMVEGLLAGVSPEDALWSPDGKAWSILEVVCHLDDEESEDFRVRLESTLTDPSRAWAPLDLDDVSAKRGYRGRDLRKSVLSFAEKRAENLMWLRGALGSADWSRAYQHPKIGPVGSASLLASWAAHDALHLRQIAKRLYELANRDSGGAPTDYAGSWTA